MRSMRLAGLTMVLVFAPVVARAQAKPAATKPATTTPTTAKPGAAKPAMAHDMSTMGADSMMKHDMAGMKHDMAAMDHEKGKGMGDMKSGWAELDAFHALLMSTWHPAEKDSLAMARTLAPTLAASAAAWEKSKGPAACDNAAARKALPQIVTDAKAYAAVAAGKANDASVKASLKKVHDGFETVAMPCMMAAMKGKPGMDSMMKAMQDKKKPMEGMDHSAMNHAPAAKKP